MDGDFEEKTPWGMGAPFVGERKVLWVGEGWQGLAAQGPGEPRSS